MISREKLYFLRCISDYLNGVKSELQENIDWETILKYSRKHHVSGIIYEQVNALLDEETKNRFFLYSASELTLYLKRVAIYENIAKRFTKENIRFFSVKGLNVAKYYPKPENRTMGDCDILVETKKMRKVDRTLKKMGFDYRHYSTYESTYIKNGMYFEIHDHLLYDEIANKKADRDFANEAWKLTIPVEDSTERILDESFHFIYLLLHLKKHLIHKGVGFRQFIDLYVSAQSIQLDWNYITIQLRQLNLLKFAQVCTTLANRWFDKEDSESPFGLDAIELDEEFFVTATEKIFSNGVFGFDDIINNQNTVLQRKILEENTTLFQKMMSNIYLVFPRYNDMRFAPRYRFVDKKPYLVPFAWIYRICLFFCGKLKEETPNEVDRSSIKEYQNRKELLDKFGLL